MELGQYQYGAVDQRALDNRQYIKRAFVVLAGTVAGVVGARSLAKKDSRLEWGLAGGLVGGLGARMIGWKLYPDPVPRDLPYSTTA